MAQKDKKNFNATLSSVFMPGMLWLELVILSSLFREIRMKIYRLQPTGLIRTGRAQQNETLRNSIFTKIPQSCKLKLYLNGLWITTERHTPQNVTTWFDDFSPFLELTENDNKNNEKRKPIKFSNHAVKNIQISWGPCLDEGLQYWQSKGDFCDY